MKILGRRAFTEGRGSKRQEQRGGGRRKWREGNRPQRRRVEELAGEKGPPMGLQLSQGEFSSLPPPMPGSPLVSFHDPVLRGHPSRVGCLP